MIEDIKLTDLTVEITQSCPNQCIFCSSFATHEAPHSITVDKIRRIGQEAVSLGLKDISISGGEPLLHSEIFQIVGFLSVLKLKVSIYTIGQRNNSSGKIVPFTDWQQFQGNNPNIIFNIQSTDSDIHDLLVAKTGSFERTLKSLKSALNNNLNVEVHLVPNKINLLSIEKTVDDLIKIGVKKISFLRLVPQGYARKHLDQLVLNIEDSEYLREMFLRLEDRHSNTTNLRFGIPFSGILDNKKTCNAGRGKLIIRYDGKVFPCEAFKDSGGNDFILGDIKDGNLVQMLNKGYHLKKLNELKKQSECECETCPAQLNYCD